MGLEFHQRMFPQRRKLYLCSVKFSGLQENSLINTEQCIYLKNDFNNNTVNKFLIMLHLHQHKTHYQSLVNHNDTLKPLFYFSHKLHDLYYLS